MANQKPDALDDPRAEAVALAYSAGDAAPRVVASYNFV